MKVRTIRLAGPVPTTGASGTLMFTTLADFQAFINENSDSGGPVDTLHQLMLDSAAYGAFGRMAGRYLLQPATEFDFVMSGTDGGETLFLQQYPIGAISAIELGYFSANGVWTTTLSVPASDYYMDAYTGRVYGAWPLDLHTVRVTWTGGFVSAELPADAKEALWIWAAVKLQRNRRARWDVKSIQAGGEGYTYHDDDCPPAAAAVFQKYRLPLGSIC